MSGLRRLLPQRYAGPGRRAAWRRTRLRRALAAALAALAAWSVAGAYLPHPVPAGVPVVVATRDLAAGAVLTAGDLATARWPRDLLPSRAVASAAALMGRVVASGVGRGEALTEPRLRGPGLLAGLTAGQVALHVPLGDPGVSGLLRPGDHVDLFAAGTGAVVGRDLLVLACDPAPVAGGALDPASPAATSPGVVVAGTEADAIRLARSLGHEDVAGPLTVALHP